MKRGLALFVGLLAFFVSEQAYAASAKPLFASDEVLQISLRGPMGKLASSRPGREAALAGTVIEGGRSLPVMLSTRGITRRNKKACRFPPLSVEFQKPPGESVFAGQKRLKLVTYCDPAANWQRYILLEYAAYRMYRVLTDQSLRVRLVRIEYAEADGGGAISRYGFFIEDVDDAAKRNGLAEAKTGDRVDPGALEPAGAAREAMFQYMIGNLDWSMTAGAAGTGCCHNSKLIAPSGAQRGLTPIPYDFDFSGLADVPYAVPPEGIPVESVRTRLYRGYCRHNTEAVAVAAEMRARRQALLAVFNELPQLEDSVKRKSLTYLGEFFDQIADEARVRSQLLRSCGA